jgi:putative ATP-dependent endonuclease of the OLD family
MSAREEVDELAGGEEPASLRLLAIRIEGFRALNGLCVSVDPRTTLLIGENNTGKTSFLEALESVLGNRRATEDDLHVAENGARAGRFVLDLSLGPADGPEFNRDLGVIFGTAVKRDAQGDEFVGIRAIGEPSADQTGLTVTYRYLQGWSSCDDDIAQVTELPQPRVERRILELLAFSLLDASRDLVAELRDRRSAWGRLVADMDIEPELRNDLEEALSGLGERIIVSSKTLERLREDLGRIRQALGSSVADVQLHPLPARVDELARAIDVLVAAPGGAAMPMRLQGMGSRSLAALMIFQAFVELRLSAGRAVRPHAINAFEEPEAHLHPHAQRAVGRLLLELPGQTIVSTHSPNVVSVMDLYGIRLFRRSGANIAVRRVTRRLDGEELARVRRLLQVRHADTLFSRLVIVVDGATEEAAFPVLARAKWPQGIETLGLSIISSDSLGQAKSVIGVLVDLGIPWIAFSDGDIAGEQAIRGIGTHLGRALDRNSPEVVMLPNGQDFEDYLLAQGCQQAIESAVSGQYGPTALADYRQSRGQGRDYASVGWEDRVIHDFLSDSKGTYGAAVAQAILEEIRRGQRQLPQEVQDLFDRADRVMAL